MVCRNEADRYLTESLRNLHGFCNAVMVYDDQSTDDSPEIIVREGPGVSLRLRLNDDPSFMDHEGLFRQNAWNYLEDWFDPQDGDWIISLDADEFLEPEIVDRFTDFLDNLDSTYVAVRFPVREVWEVRKDRPWVRTDGFWGSITAIRAIRWFPNAQFADKTMASGSVPKYDGKTADAPFEILHYGYTDPEIRQKKYERYHGKPGHNPKHVDSILQNGMLVPWSPLL